MIQPSADIFSLTTFAIAAIGWVIAFIASAVGSSRFADFMDYTWCANIFQLFILVVFYLAMFRDTVDRYRLALLSFLAIGIMQSTIVIDKMVYSRRTSEQAVGAGHILLCIMNILWVYSLGAGQGAIGKDLLMMPENQPRGKAFSSVSTNPQFGGKENMPMGRLGVGRFSSSNIVSNSISAPIHQSSPATSGNYNKEESGAGGESPSGNLGSMVRPVTTASLDYPHRAKAIYSYDANPEDPNELSFTKGEIFEVSDTSGKCKFPP